METIIGTIIVIVIALWLIENVIWPLIKITAQISWYVGIIAGIVIISIGGLFAFFISIRAFLRALKNNINPYDTYIDNHTHTEGVKRGYFFGPGWHQVRSIWEGSYSELFKGNEKIEKLAKSWLQNINIITFIFFDMWVYLFWGAARTCIYIFGSVWTFIFCSLLSIIVAIGALLFFTCFTFLSISDRLALLINSIQSRCPDCKRINTKPLFKCPKCNAIHDLTPGPYGIFRVKCSCNNLLPTTAFNGRNNLTAICTKCRHTLPGYAEQFGIQLVGDTSSGKTTYLSAFFHDYKEKMPDWVKCSYVPEDKFDTLENWYKKGISNATFNTNAEMYSIIHSLPLYAPYQFAMYDIAGEVFRISTSTGYLQHQFQYSEGIILIVDIDNTPEDTQDTISSFISEYRNLKGINIERMNTTPTAIVISKADLYDELKGAYQEQDILKKFLFDHKFNSVMNFIEANFSNTKYFATSAMGHKPNDTSYNPIDVLNPVEWIFSKRNSILFKILNRQSMAYEHLKFYLRKILTFIPPFVMLALLTYGIINVPYDEISYRVSELFYNVTNFSEERIWLDRNTLKLAKQEDAIAQTELGNMYYKMQNYLKAMQWYRKAADHGYMIAQDKLGDMYRDGVGVAIDYKEAWKWYRQSVAQGYIGAQASYGFMYKNGYGVEKNYAKAIEWYKKAIEQGDVNSMNSVGELYMKGGYGIEKNYAKAVEYYHKAAEQGHIQAQVHLGNEYYNGRGIERDYSEAVKWYRKAAEQGLAEAQNNLGEMYSDGEGVTKDHREAIKWFQRASEQDYARAQNNLGNAYRNGWGVKQDYSEAVKWYRKAAEQGFASSQNYLGVMYHNGDGVQQDRQEAIRWFYKAAEQGYNWAQNNLGNAYRNGWGVKQDYSEAVKWYRKAAEQGLASSQNSLGIMYEEALGINRNIGLAIEFYQKAAKQGNEEAKKSLMRLQVDKFKVLNEPHFSVANNRINIEFIGAFRGGNPDGTRQYGRQSTTGVLFYFVANSRRKNTEIRIDQSDLFDKKGKKFDTRGWSSIIGQSTTTRKMLTNNRPTLIGFGFHMPASESEELPTIDSVRFQFNEQWYEIRNVKVRTWAEWESIRNKRGLK